MKCDRYIFTLFFFAAVVNSVSICQDNRLDYFISEGLLHSPLLKDFKDQVSSNSLDSLLIKAGQKPQVSYNGLLYYAPVINGVGYSEVITNLSNLTSVVYVSQRIFNQKNLESLYAKPGIQNQALRISAKLTENDLRKAITLQFLSVCSVSNDIKSGLDMLASIKDEEHMLKQLVENGLYKQVDYLSFMVELKAQELLLSDLQIQFRKEFSALNMLCGLPDTTYGQLELPEIRLSYTSNPSNSPFFRRFAVDSLKIQNEKLLVDRNYKPSFNWFADAGLLNNMPREIGRNFV